MPTDADLERFVALVESGRTVDAMVAFYGDDATMRENQSPPRAGKANLIRHEEAALATLVSLQARCVRPWLIAGDHAVIRWVFEMRNTRGDTHRLEELAWQRWAYGRIVEEQFFYDPAQMR
jgi:hypothetical protein